MKTLVTILLTFIHAFGFTTGTHSEKHLSFDMPSPWVRGPNSEPDYFLPLSNGGPVNVGVTGYDDGPNPQKLVEVQLGIDPNQTKLEERMIANHKVFIGRHFGPYSVNGLDGWISVATFTLDDWTIQISMDDDVDKYPDAFNHLVQSFKFK